MDAVDPARLAVALVALILSAGLAACHPHQDAEASPAHVGFALPVAAGNAAPQLQELLVYMGERFSVEQQRMADHAPEAPPPGF